MHDEPLKFFFQVKNKFSPIKRKQPTSLRNRLSLNLLKVSFNLKP